jgi:hypothetical protein
VTPQPEEYLYEVIFKVANQSLLRFEIKCNSKNDAKKIVAFETLGIMFPQAYNWILINNNRKADILRKTVSNLDLSKFSKVKKQSNDMMREIYNKFEGEVLDSDYKEKNLSENIFIDNE